MSRSESQRRYLAYLSALALTVTPVVVSTSSAQAAGPVSVSAEKLAALQEQAAKPGATPMGTAGWTECIAEWSQNC